MEVVKVITLRGKTYRILKQNLGLYFIQKKIKLMHWEYFKDWYGPSIFLSREQAVKYILFGYFK